MNLHFDPPRVIKYDGRVDTEALVRYLTDMSEKMNILVNQINKKESINDGKRQNEKI